MNNHNKTIQFYRKNVYGNANILQKLTQQKTIDGKIRELLRDLTNGYIQFEEVIASN